MHHFVVKFSKFSFPQAARGHSPPNQNPVDVPARTPTSLLDHGLLKATLRCYWIHWLSNGLRSIFDLNRSFRRRSSQSISCLALKKTKPNKTNLGLDNAKSKWSKLTQKTRNCDLNLYKNAEIDLNVTKQKFKNCSHLCAYRCVAYNTSRSSSAYYWM